MGAPHCLAGYGRVRRLGTPQDTTAVTTHRNVCEEESVGIATKLETKTKRVKMKNANHIKNVSNLMLQFIRNDLLCFSVEAAPVVERWPHQSPSTTPLYQTPTAPT